MRTPSLEFLGAFLDHEVVFEYPHDFVHCRPLYVSVVFLKRLRDHRGDKLVTWEVPDVLMSIAKLSGGG